MKKLLTILSSAVLVTGPLTAVVACGSKANGTAGWTQTQKDMLDGAEFISKLIVSSKHENLNFSINEILSALLVPGATAMNMPLNYTYKGESINLSGHISKYKTLLAPNIRLFDNGGYYTGIFASYIMGMYDNSFYKNLITPIKGLNEEVFYAPDTFSKTGDVGYNKSDNKNAMGIAAGLHKDLKLSKDENRRNLAWGIQDTGALTNFLLNNGFDGSNPGDTNATGGPASGPSSAGTNGHGYAWYNSTIWKGQAKCKDDSGILGCLFGYAGEKVLENKLENSGITYTAAQNNELTSTLTKGEKTLGFNSTGALMATTAGKLNIDTYAANFAGILDSLAETDTGAIALATFMNSVFPIIQDKDTTYGTIQQIGFSILTSLWSGLDAIKKDENLLKIAGLEAIDFEGLIDPIGAGKKDISLFDDKVANSLTKLIDKMMSKHNSLDKEGKKDFASKLILEKTSPFYNAFIKIIERLPNNKWNDVMKDDASGAMNLLNYYKLALKDIRSKSFIKSAEEIKAKFGSTNGFVSLTNKQQKEYLEILGYKDGKFDKDKSMWTIYNNLIDPNVQGQKEFRDLFYGFSNAVNAGMEPLHENVFKYITDEEYWNTKDASISTTDNTSADGTLKFVLEYNGVGDPTSNASKQTKKVDVPDNFNPYQTIRDNQTDKMNDIPTDLIDQERLDGKPLGVDALKMSDEDLIAYDGTGQFENYQKVNNKYEIEWKNISTDPERPYWIITSLKSFNANNEEFFSIY